MEADELDDEFDAELEAELAEDELFYAWLDEYPLKLDTKALRPAPLWRRIGAFAADLMTLVVMASAGMASAALAGWYLGGLSADAAASRVLVVLGIVAAGVLYCRWARRVGRTPGMQVAGVQLARIDDGQPADGNDLERWLLRRPAPADDTAGAFGARASGSGLRLTTAAALRSASDAAMSARRDEWKQAGLSC